MLDLFPARHLGTYAERRGSFGYPQLAPDSV
jgi:hypothetical protein